MSYRGNSKSFGEIRWASLKFLITDTNSQKKPVRCSLKIAVRFMTDDLHYLI